ncbi:MAG: metal-sensitive transcriptional regulator [Chloroflexota bacterium]|nr:metal-sensitive transcriptional regulator [Chloroflexota bacterium]
MDQEKPLLPQIKKDTSLRLKTIRGHLDGIQKMVEDEVYCVDIMKQIAAVQASLEKVNQLILRNHLHTCFADAIKAGSGDEKIEELMDALKYNKCLTDGRLVADGWAAEAETTAPAGAHAHFQR